MQLTNKKAKVRFSKAILQIALVTIFTRSISFANLEYEPVEGSSFDSGEFGTVWIDYMSTNSKAAADRLIQMVPSDAKGSISTHFYKESVAPSLHRLQNRITLKDETSVQVAFILMTLTKNNAECSEWLDEMLGHLIPINPSMYLRELKLNYRRLRGGRVDGGLVGNLGSKLVDKLPEQRAEIQRRIRALKSVHDATLASVRDECVRLLESDEQTLKATGN